MLSTTSSFQDDDGFSVNPGSTLKRFETSSHVNLVEHVLLFSHAPLRIHPTTRNVVRQRKVLIWWEKSPLVHLSKNRFKSPERATRQRSRRGESSHTAFVSSTLLSLGMHSGTQSENNHGCISNSPPVQEVCADKDVTLWDDIRFQTELLRWIPRRF